MEEEQEEPGRSRRRREVKEASVFARPLVALDPVQLAAVPLPELIREEVRLGATLTAHGALDRQLRRIDSLVRCLPAGELAALEAFLADPERAHTEREDRLSTWVRALRVSPEAALTALGDRVPPTELNDLRPLVRSLDHPARGARAAGRLRERLAALLPPGEEGAPPGVGPRG